MKSLPIFASFIALAVFAVSYAQPPTSGSNLSLVDKVDSVLNQQAAMLANQKRIEERLVRIEQVLVGKTDASAAIQGGMGDKPSTRDVQPYVSVKGLVTLDGQPVRVRLTFTDERGFYRSAITNDDGRYEAFFGDSVGEFSVAINSSKDVSRRIPAVYNAKSELSVKLKPGANKFDFELQSR